MQLGLEALLGDPDRLARLRNRRVAVLAHAASVTADLTHALDALAAAGVRPTCAFGPQHGFLTDAQDNMVETDHVEDAERGLRVWSLYGDTRRLTEEMLDAFDVLLVDLQDVGTRIYTFVTTTLWAMEDCARAGKTLWVLDRPNPAGRTVEGRFLRPGYESFVGPTRLILRHGLTLGELARWHARRLDGDFDVVPMRGWSGGWPAERAWVNPSPNAATPFMPHAYPGTVLLEGTTLSEGRGTTRPLEQLGAPDLDPVALLADARRLAPDAFAGAVVRPCAFTPTFHKHAGLLCRGFQLHGDLPAFDPVRFRPYRIVAAVLKALRLAHPDYALWRDFHYEYERDRLAIDLIDGADALRTWVDDPAAAWEAFEAPLLVDEAAWRRERAPFLLYP